MIPTLIALLIAILIALLGGLNNDLPLHNKRRFVV